MSQINMQHCIHFICNLRVSVQKNMHMHARAPTHTQKHAGIAGFPNNLATIRMQKNFHFIHVHIIMQDAPHSFQKIMNLKYCMLTPSTFLSPVTNTSFAMK
jgi:hypothetical protein